MYFGNAYIGNAYVVGGYAEMERIATPASPPANKARLFAQGVNGGAKTALFAIFPTGAQVEIVREP